MSVLRLYIAKAELEAKQPMILIHEDGQKQPTWRAFEVAIDGPCRLVYKPQGPVPAKVYVEVEGTVRIVRPDLGEVPPPEFR